MRLGRRLFSGAVAGVAVIAATVMAISPASAESNGGVRVMPLGDSITDGMGVPGGYRINLWSKLVAGGYKVDFVGSLSNGPASLGDHDHEGHSGWTIAQIDSNITNWLRTYKPHTVLLHIGTNDMYGSDPGGAPSRLSTLLDHITTQAPDAELFVATIIPLSMSNSAVQTFNAKVPGIVQTRAAAGKRVHLVQMYGALTTSDLADGVHPNAGGYAKMATVWYDALRSVPGSLTDGTPSPSSSSPSAPASASSPASSPSSVPPSKSPSASVSPSKSASASVPASSSASVPSSCSIGYVISAWSTGLTASVTIANTGSAPINGWTLAFTLPSGQAVTSGWSATYASSNGAVTATNVGYNGTIPPGGSTSIGFQASHSGNTAKPASFTLNGSPCTSS